MRLKRIDILRGVAILMVLIAHSQLSHVTGSIGWSGVDLFFVLSGFLISGLLYSEYKKLRDISFRRFFVRRGLKIYPAFYVMILATFAAQHLLWHGAPSPLSSFANEIFFIQNYRYGVWGHTWSLAVEEHFYIGLAILLLLLGRFSSNRPDPFRYIPAIFASLAVLCLAFRGLALWVFPRPENFTPTVMNATHTRIDALFFGVFLGYLYHFRPQTLQKLLGPVGNRLLIGLVSAVFLSVCYFFNRDSDFLLFIGLTALYLGYGGVLLLSLQTHGLLSGRTEKLADKLGTATAYLGKHSYSVYLWHVAVLQLIAIVLRKLVHIPIPLFPVAIIGILTSCIVGIFFAHIIEFPVLKLRDRLFPMLQKSATTTPAPGVAVETSL
jgi:peptidoglycan/LPS O-acetylase OafA/YrhL